MYVRADQGLGRAPQASPAAQSMRGPLFHQMQSALASGQWYLALTLAVLSGNRDVNSLTSTIFYARHPERRGQALKRGEPQFAELRREWLDIRDRLVQPALRALRSDRGPGAVPPRATTAVPTAAPDQHAFLERVLAAHLARSTRTKGPALFDLSKAELAPVLGTDINMRGDAAAAAGRLLATANRDLAAAKAAGDPDAQRTIRISAASGYRDRAHQERLWRKYFTERYYAETAARRASLPGGPHGDSAVNYMIKYVSPKIAAPGFSRHQAGLAIDFQQRRTKGNAIRNSTRPTWVKKWRNTWFFRWLQANAARFGFTPYAKEPWHWTYNPSA